MELRCNSKLHGILEESILEIKCNSKFCGAEPGIVILHQFNNKTGILIKTLRFLEPKVKGEKQGAVDSSTATIRT